jgi:serine/threonine protein kinase
MAWVEGRDLGNWLAEAPTVATRLTALGNVADALDELHRAGQVHADVKPANILVGPMALPTGATAERAVLVDFGLMRAITGLRPSEVGYSAGYVAPELRQGAPYSPASDLFALAGVVLYALSGEHPPATGDVAAEARRRLDTLGIPQPTIDAVVAGLQPLPVNRPQGCGAWLAQVRDGMSSSTIMMAAAPVGPVGPSTEGPDAKDKKGSKALSVALRVAVSLTVTVTAAIGGAKYAQSGEDKAAAPVAHEKPSTTTTTEATTTTSTTEPDTTSTSEDTTDATSPVVGSVTRLDEMTAVDNGGNSYSGIYPEQQVSTNGRTYAHALVGQADCSTGDAWVDYDLSRDWKRFTTTIGIGDSSPAQSTATFKIFVDGKQVATGDVALGRPGPVDLDVSQGLRLRLEMLNTTCGKPFAQRASREAMVFADPTLKA